MPTNEVSDQTAWSALEIGFPVDDIAPMRRFYVEGLGFKSAGRCDLPNTHIEAFRFGDCLLKLTYFLDENLRPKPRQPELSAPYVTLRVSDLDGLAKRCQAIGASLIVPVTPFTPKNAKPGRFAFFADPMGNRIELVEGDAWSE